MNRGTAASRPRQRQIRPSLTNWIRISNFRTFLDTVKGTRGGHSVAPERHDSSGKCLLLVRGKRDQDGRLRQLLPDGATRTEGLYRLRFDTASYSQVNVYGLYRQ